MGPLLVLALVVVPLVEVYVLVQVGQQLGALPTVGLLLVMSLLGAYLLRREGAKTWRAFRTGLTSGRVPAREVADGALVVFGGALLLTPGFATDLFGLACVLPPSRAVLRRILMRSVTRRLGAEIGVPRRPTAGPPRRDGRAFDGRAFDGVVDGEVIDGRADRPPDP